MSVQEHTTYMSVHKCTKCTVVERECTRLYLDVKVHVRVMSLQK